MSKIVYNSFSLFYEGITYNVEESLFWKNFVITILVFHYKKEEEFQIKVCKRFNKDIHSLKNKIINPYMSQNNPLPIKYKIMHHKILYMNNLIFLITKKRLSE